MTIILLSFALAASTANAAPPPRLQQDEQTIVVTGRSLAETERALRDCLARQCPPNEDIDAALSHAENLFVAGKYKDARGVTLAAIGRDGRYRKSHPVDVSDLYRANSRIAAHLGEGRDYEWSTGEMHRILGSALPSTDPRVIEADFELADMYASFGRTRLARQMFQTAERKAVQGGRPDLAGIARVRAAWLHQAEGDTWLTRQELRKIAADRAPSATVGRVAAMVLLARLDRQSGDGQTSADLVDQMRGLHMRQPVLLFAPHVDLNWRFGENGSDDPTMVDAGSTTRLLPTDNFEDRWIDVGFWVTPDGKVSEPEILRSSGPTDWTPRLMRSIAGRAYSPIAEPTYKVERYSYTSRYMNVTGTRIRQRSPNARIEYVDLSVDPPTAMH